MFFSAIFHMILLLIISIPLTMSAVASKSKPVEVSLITAEQIRKAKEALQREKERQMAEKKLVEEKRIAEGKAKQEAEESKKQLAIEEAKQKWRDKLEGANPPVLTKPYRLPSVGPETAEKEQQVRGEGGNKMLDDKGFERSVDNVNFSVPGRGNEDERFINEVITKGEKTKEAGRKPISEVVSYDSAKFRSYSKKYSNFGEEKQFNFMIDFNFSSNRMRERFLNKYDISVVPTKNTVNLLTDNKESYIYFDKNLNPELSAVRENYINRYRVIPFGYLDNSFMYIYPGVTADAMEKSSIKGVIEQYHITNPEEFIRLIRSSKVVIVLGIDEERMNFKLLEFGLYPLSQKY